MDPKKKFLKKAVKKAAIGKKGANVGQKTDKPTGGEGPGETNPMGKYSFLGKK